MNTNNDSTGEINRKRGTVKWFNRGIGYIEQDEPNKPDLFVHFKHIEMEGFKVLYPKDKVSFIEDDFGKGAIATQVIKEKGKGSVRNRRPNNG